MPELSEDEIIARDKRRSRNLVIASPFIALIMIGLLVWWRDWPLYFPFVLAGGLCFLLFFFHDRRAYTPSALRKRVDEFQGYSKLMLLIMICVVGMALLQKPGIDLQVTAKSSIRPQWMFFSMLLVAASLIAFGPGWANRKYNIVRNDELAQSIRAQATRIGYLVLMAALCATYAALLYRPDLVLTVLRSGLFAGIAIPSLAYLILEWRAGRFG